MTTTSHSPAFPLDAEVNANRDTEHLGLTKREYFAAMAMQGMGTWMPLGNGDLMTGYTLFARGEWAVKQADALIAALNEVKP